MAVINMNVCGPRPSTPMSPRPATTDCATARTTPIISIGRIIATRFRYTMIRIMSTIRTVAISMTS
jgi:hypothetical protein